ncbi:MAG: hypothetical protein JXR51_03220 [Bacteroidales bacterium]|nr:hypothetical protein [Bacteroidales bacterium]
MQNKFWTSFKDFIIPLYQHCEYCIDKEINQYKDISIAEIYKSHLFVLDKCANVNLYDKESAIKYIKKIKAEEIKISDDINDKKKFKKNYIDYCDELLKKIENYSFEQD